MSIRNKSKDLNAQGRISRKFTSPGNGNMTTPSWWTRLYMTRPRRLENKSSCRAILRGADPDGMNFPPGNRKPHKYYW